MWQLSGTPSEIIIRAVCIYVGVFVLFRLIGKKQIGELAPVDFVLLMIISESVSRSITGDEDSIPGGLLAAFTLLVVNYATDTIMARYRSVEKIIEGEPQFLIKDGRILHSVLRKSTITEQDLGAELRRNGVDKVEEVAYAVLETSGHINVIKKTK